MILDIVGLIVAFSIGYFAGALVTHILHKGRLVGRIMIDKSNATYSGSMLLELDKGVNDICESKYIKLEVRDYISQK